MARSITGVVLPVHFVSVENVCVDDVISTIDAWIYDSRVRRRIDLAYF